MKKLTVFVFGAALIAGCASAPEKTASAPAPAAAAAAPAATAAAVTTTAAAVTSTAAAAVTTTAASAVAPTPAPAADEILGSLQVKDVVIGTGSEAVAGKNVSVSYTGRLLTGKQFDSSVGKPPFQFRLDSGQVIKGWDMGVAGMKVGGKRQLVIPPHLGYGANGVPGVIPPNATLVFDVELLGVE